MLKNVIERFYALAYQGEEYPREVHELYDRKDAALLLTAADNTWSTFHWAKSYWETCLVNFFLYNNKGCLLAGGCGLENFNPEGSRHIETTNHLVEAYEFGKNIYANEGAMADNTVIVTNAFNYDK